MKKKGVIITLVGLFLMALTGSAFAWSGRAGVGGIPEQFRPGGHIGYYIWQDERGFHIWTTTRGEEHVFTGVIRTDGTFERVHGRHLDDGDSYNVADINPGRYWFRFSQGDDGRHFAFRGHEVGLDNNRIRFKLDTAAGSEGLNFRVRDARFIDFDLFVDGHPIPHRDIFISYSGWHPMANRFRLDQ